MVTFDGANNFLEWKTVSSKPTVWDGDGSGQTWKRFRHLRSKPTVWDGDLDFYTASFILNNRVLSPPCGMATPLGIA